MAKRHILQVGDWESIFGRLQELVLANSGEDEFQEIFKILVAKLYDESHYPKNRVFGVYPTPAETSRIINKLIAEAANQWKGIIQEQPITKLRDEHLTICVQEITEIEFLDSNAEVLDNLFEYLVSQAAKGSKGQYFTPRHVIECCIRIIDPKPTDTILDPACGSAGFLFHAFDYVRKQTPNLELSEYCRKNLWGCDFDLKAIQVAKALTLIAGLEKANIFRLNSLLTPLSNRTLLRSESQSDEPNVTIEDLARLHLKNFKGFDIIMTNPPFAGEIRESNIMNAYELASGRERIERDVLFLERCIQLLRPGGKLCIILPHNKFGSKQWERLRHWLLRHMCVVSVLGLGRNTFLPHTHQKTSILFGIKRSKVLLNHEVLDEDILFLISEKDGKDSKGKIITRLNAHAEDSLWMRADHDLDQLSNSFKNFTLSSKVAW
jgi:type I restriction enzyme M protein